MTHLNHNGIHKTIRRQLRHLVKTSRVVILMIGCLHAKANVPNEVTTKKSQWQNPRSLSIADPKSKAVVLFLHGSVVEKLDDTCDPSGATPGFFSRVLLSGLLSECKAGLSIHAVSGKQM